MTPLPPEPASPAELSRWDRLRMPQGPGPLHDYIRRPYAPAADPAGRAASESVLRWFLETEGLDGLWPVITRFRELLGPGETVWGVKQLPDGRAGVELYVYDLARDGQRTPKGPGDPRSVSALVAGLAPLLDVDSQLDDHRAAYLMCSLELDAQVLHSGRSPGFRIYTPGDRRVHGYDGLSWLVAGRELVRENSYLFFRAQDELAAVRAQVQNSPRGAAAVDDLLDPGLCDCFTICFAHKRDGDALYFSRVHTDQLLPWMERRWPGPLCHLLRARRDDLCHLRWDLGLDFAVPSHDLSQVTVRKVGLYGFL